MVEQYLTAEELARKLNVPISWIYSRTRARCPHAMPVLRVGKYCRFIERDVIEWLKTLANSGCHKSGK
jgi:predicted DNA-binding transcriptional regulator AlpA